MNDEAFLTAFTDATLPQAEWTHAAHVRMAFLTLARLPFAEAMTAIRTGIQRYNEAHLNFVGYHETITVTFVHLIADRMRQTPTRCWDAFAAAHPELLSAAILGRHYAPETLKSATARAAFVAPDREPLP